MAKKKKDKPQVIGATFGKSKPQATSAILVDDSVGLYDFLTVDDILIQIKDVTVKTTIDQQDAREIALGNAVVGRNDVIATLDIIGSINGSMSERLHPIMPGSKLKLATAKQITHYLGFDNGGSQIGHLKRRPDIPIMIQNDWLGKHVSIMGMTGAGKSNLSKVILSAMQERIETPIIIIDPHGEYEGDIIDMDNLDTMKCEEIQVGDVVSEMNKMLKGKERDTWRDVVISARPSSTIKKKDLTGIAALWDCCDDYYVRGASDLKDRLLDVLRQVKTRQVLDKRVRNHFGSVPLVISLKGCDKATSETAVMILSELVLALGKEGQPMITIIDEVQNYCPQKRKNISKDAIINLLKEGRKFGCGCVIMSQRPADVDKGIISQCNTKFALKLTNENDIRQVRASTEYATRQMFQDVQKLQCGEALLTSPWLKRPVFIRIHEWKGE